MFMNSRFALSLLHSAASAGRSCERPRRVQWWGTTQAWPLRGGPSQVTASAPSSFLLLLFPVVTSLAVRTLVPGAPECGARVHSEAGGGLEWSVLSAADSLSLAFVSRCSVVEGRRWRTELRREWSAFVVSSYTQRCPCCRSVNSSVAASVSNAEPLVHHE